MKSNDNGLYSEYELINYINEKQYHKNMNKNIQEFLSCIFPFDLKSKKIKARKYYANYKPDIEIIIDDTHKYISVKNGSNNSVHQEHIYSFLTFVSTLTNNQEFFEYLRLFHFNDGTKDGSGESRKSAIDFQLYNQNKIKKINDIFNARKNIEIIADRLLFKGEYKNIPEVDWIYYGNVDEGVWASKKEILNYLKNNVFFSASPHVSKLYYQSLHRNLKKDLYYEPKRYYVQFKWHSLKEDLEKIKKTRKKA